MRQAAQCVGRIIRSKKDYGVIVFADKRYGSADKRSKLPQWVLQFLPDSHLSVAADASVHLTRSFIKSMSQARPLNEGLGKSLLSVGHIEAINEEKRKKGEFAFAGMGGAGPGGGGVIGALAAASIAVRQQLERQQQFQKSGDGAVWEGGADDLLGLAYTEDDPSSSSALVVDDEEKNSGGGVGSEQSMIEAAFRATLRAERKEKTPLFGESGNMRDAIIARGEGEEKESGDDEKGRVVKKPRNS